MTGTIAILSARADATHCAEWLQSHAPEREVRRASDLAGLEAEVARTAGALRLISFLTDVIVPASLLSRLGTEAYNIHPGPPERPGAHPDSFALYEGDKTFGVTAHVMAPKVDTGAILRVDRFPIPDGIARLAFGDLVLGHAIRLFAEIGLACLGTDGPLPRCGVDWSGPARTRRDFARLCAAPPDLAASEAARRARACGPSFALAQSL